MSAFLAITRPDSIDLLADTAHYRSDLVLVETRSKIFTLEDQPCAITGRGEIGVVEAFAEIAPHFAGSLDDVIQRFPDILAFGVAAIAERWELLIAGWSEALSRPVALYAVSQDAAANVHGGQYDPGELYLCGPVFGCGPYGLAESIADLDSPEAIENFDPRTEGLPIFEAMRRTPMTSDQSGATGHIVGGFLEFVSVNRDGVSRQTIHDWPDVIGRPIDPFPVTGEAA